MGADLSEKPSPLLLVGNDPGEGQVRIVVDEDLADIEDNMLYFRRHGPSFGI
jgi:hypothetical protein